MVLMTVGMTCILHHSSDLGDGDGMGVMGGRFKMSVSQFHTWTLYLDLILLEQDYDLNRKTLREQTCNWLNIRN